MKSFLLAVLVLLAPQAQADRGILGDDDPFPIACIDFTGLWMSDEGQEYAVQQDTCRMIRIQSWGPGAKDNSMTIVPDNKSRQVKGNKWNGMERHRWNAKHYGTIIETYRRKNFSDRRVSEVVLLEIVNDNLLLESTYRSIEVPNAPSRREYSQQVFRRAALPID